MKRAALPMLTVLLLAVAPTLDAATLALASPLDYQVFQRFSKAKGSIRIAGVLTDADTKAAGMEARITADGKAGEWRRLPVTFTGAKFETVMEASAGGWYRVEVRAMNNNAVLAEASAEHVGVGEVYVVAGQSNSGNYGSEKQTTKTGRVAAFDGKRWQVANDPQPGAGGKSGSFMPPFGDAIVQRFDVPVGILACGAGGTSVRHWLPKGMRSPILPTGGKSDLPGGEWVSNGKLFDNLVARTKQMGPHGFRAVLWHQGESDANQQDPKRTLPGKLYRQYLEQIIRDSRRAVGWDVPWFVAQVSYHSPADTGSGDIRAAQKSLWDAGIALQGPDTDALGAEYRGGVHFNGKGLREHGVRWAEKVGPWLEKQTKP